ncbi:TetR/AcrR family transcriptional regulator [Lentzea flava]|uniref:TetR family transcriptional regulator n=1 Tax=Lentzea flava TaxID=103732 RepID=A0ABQ2UHT9_9PSEU|nr:TetR/AcrR family transcriptional regulator [Lentzea flava]MCP2199619.1 transcriptional regulator, TetR family [Lentzea flava]GGU36866.1 TetR family transcriptional regulator [Lentzea flava]
MNTRDRIVAAAAEVMRTRGLARATTKEIAKAAGFSEAALYKHFRDKTELFVAVLGERGPTRLSRVLVDLPDRLGQDPVEEVLRDVALAAADFYEQTFPMAASLFAEPKVFDAHRAALRERGKGPHQVGEAVATYLKAEQALGRINAGVDPRAAAGMLLGACLERAFLGHFVDGEDRPSEEEFAARLVDALLSGISVK